MAQVSGFQAVAEIIQGDHVEYEVDQVVVQETGEQQPVVLFVVAHFANVEDHAVQQLGVVLNHEKDDHIDRDDDIGDGEQGF